MRADRNAAGTPAVDYLHQVQREDRLADKVVGMLRKAILDGRLAPGDRLPPERILGERFGVSRTVVREAIRSLAAKGLVDVRSGSGSVVAGVGAGAVSETMQLFLHSAAIDRRSVEEVRAALWVDVAGAAAARATDEDVHDLRQVLRAMDLAAGDQRACAAQDAEFHRCLARAARNPLYPVLLDALGGAPPAAAIRGHERIVERIASHDPPGARDEMRRHLAAQVALTQ